MTPSQLTKFTNLADRLKRLAEMRGSIKQNTIQFEAGVNNDNFLNDLPDSCVDGIADIVEESVNTEIADIEVKLRDLLNSESAYQ